MGIDKKEIAAQFREAGSTVDNDKTHVIISNGAWKLVKEGNQRASATFPSKEAAVEEARKFGRSGNAKVVIIHKTDGTVEKIINY